MAEGTQFVRKYQDVEGFDIYGQTNFAVQYMYDKFPGKIKWDREVINVTSIDIETKFEDGFPHPEDADQEVTAITCKSNTDDTFHVFGCGEYTPSKPNVKYVQCMDERELLSRYVMHMQGVDIITGWNVKEFDIPYLVVRIEKICGKEVMKKLSPWGDVKDDTPKFGDKFYKPKLQFKLGGITILDYMELFKKFTYNTIGTQESYRLDHIANVVLGDSKLSFDEYSNLNELYEKDYQKFIDYNIKDVDIVDRLDDKLDLISLALTMAYNSGANYIDVLGTVSIWDTIIYRDLAQRKITIPPKVENIHGKFAGGYVKEPQVGKHDWVCSFDLASLYPSIIMQYNMSPETLHPFSIKDVNVYNVMHDKVQNEKDDVSLAVNGSQYYTKKEGLMPRLIQDMYNGRVGMKNRMINAQKELETIDPHNKQEMYRVERDIQIAKNQQMAIKILLNSLYGAMGNRWFRYYDRRIAEAVTLTGQLTIQWAEKAINKYMNDLMNTHNLRFDGSREDYVVAIDTDSVYVKLGSLVDKFKPKNPVQFLDKICKEQLEKVLEDCYDELFKMLGGRENKMIMEREVIADRGIWTAKKRYILNVHNNEGVQYKEPQLKVMGIESVKSSTPQIVRDALKEIFKSIVSKEESDVQKEIAQFREYFCKANPEDVAFPRGVNGIAKWKHDGEGIYKKGTPIHVRGAILHNHYTDKTKVATIESGDKIKFTYLKTPNPIQSNIISFVDYLPQELGLHDYVDYETQFEKTFISAIQPILKSIGWRVEHTVSLEDFF
tara:strand:+ start:24998 stop:27325 length:2328 start_codon:yes stop_codon:yes gene_type:complete